MRIFVSVASYRDDQLVKTLHSALENAKYPNDLDFAVLTQDHPKKHPDLDFVPNITHLTMSYKDARGAGFARKTLMEEYNGQEYFFQTDSHMRFAPNWDVRMITMLDKAQQRAKNKKIILSQFPAPYKIFTNGKEHYPQGDPYYWSDPSWTSVVRTDSDVWAGNREFIVDKTKPHPSWTVLAGYIFAPGSLPLEVPYDERISFMGEELCFAIRAYTRGWEIYAPNEMLLWHFYNRKGRPKVWSQRDNVGRKQMWPELEKISAQIQRDVLTGKEKGIYGIGNEKLYKKYQKMIGIDFNEFYRNRGEI